MTNYQSIKKQLKEIANEAKSQFKSDKPAIGQIINDSVDYFCKENNLTDRQRDLLSDYACKLHPKE